MRAPYGAQDHFVGRNGAHVVFEVSVQVLRWRWRGRGREWGGGEGSGRSHSRAHSTARRHLRPTTCAGNRCAGVGGGGVRAPRARAPAHAAAAPAWSTLAPHAAAACLRRGARRGCAWAVQGARVRWCAVQPARVVVSPWGRGQLTIVNQVDFAGRLPALMRGTIQVRRGRRAVLTSSHPPHVRGGGAGRIDGGRV